MKSRGGAWFWDYLNALSALAQLAIVIVTIIFAAVSFHRSAPESLQNISQVAASVNLEPIGKLINADTDRLFVSVFALFIGLILSAQVREFISGVAKDRAANEEKLRLAKQDAQRDRIEDALASLPLQVLRNSELRPLANAEEGIAHCIRAAAELGGSGILRNTVFRFGSPTTTRDTFAPSFNLWLDAKRNAALRGTTVMELVSSHFIDKDPQSELIRELAQMTNYKPKYIDDTKAIHVQMTSFWYSANDPRNAVVFGWEFPGPKSYGPSLLTHNAEAVSFWESYFDEIHRRAEINRALLSVPADSPVVIPRAVEKHKLHQPAGRAWLAAKWRTHRRSL